MKKQTLNEYLLKNPDALKSVFVNLFGKYLIRYYEKGKGCTVEFSYYEETSYWSGAKKKIVIARANVIKMLQKNVPVLAVAYHELCHLLFTSDRSMTKIQKQVKDHFQTHTFYDNNRYIAHDNIHTIWNILEDERVERLLVKKFPFLKDIIEPLHKILRKDEYLMSWRKRLNKHPQRLHELCEEYANPKKKVTIDRASAIIIELIETYFPLSNAVFQNPMEKIEVECEDYEPEIEEENEENNENVDENNENVDENSDKEEENNENVDENDDEEDENSDKEDDEETHDANIYNPNVEKYEHREIDDFKNEENLGDALSKLDEIKQLDAQGEEVIKGLLEEYQETLDEEEQRKLYNQAVIPNEDSVQKGPRVYLNKVRDVYNAKAIMRKGMSQGQRKAYSVNISNRVSVQRILETQASRKAPKVFYGKGQDLEFMKKVVIFEDVSGSVGGFAGLFSSIGLALSKSFEQVEWWGYANRLFKKNKRDYGFTTYSVNNYKKGGGGTSSENLLHVMKKYKNSDNLYVIITDGDMERFFQDEETYKIFKDRTCVVGILDNEIKNKMPHTVDIQKELNEHNKDKEYHERVSSWDLQYQNKLFEKLVVTSVTQAIQILQNRIKG